MGKGAPDVTRNTGSLKFNQNEIYRKNIGKSEARQQYITATKSKQHESKGKTENIETPKNSYIGLMIVCVLITASAYAGYVYLKWIIQQS